MEVVEIRDLDGPNLFRMEPVIKVELAFDDGEERENLLNAVTRCIGELHAALGLPSPEATRHTVDDPSRAVVAFGWEFRSCAVGIGRVAVDVALPEGGADTIEALRERLKRDQESDDRPLWIRDSERTKPAVGITGTNGKTTTTRLLAHIVAESGKRVSWSSSTGVYVEGRQVLEGDYSGPSGARRALQDPDVEVAILETARGGLLLRGLAYESNDVSIFLNVSADHLAMQGVATLATLAEVKSVVVRATRHEGLVVLNADDPLVLSYRDRVRAPVALFSQQARRLEVRAHVAAGGMALVRDGANLVLHRDGRSEALIELARIPMAYGGAAPFMVENALAAAAGALGLGIPIAQVAAGLASFRNDSSSNRGRLNVFDLEERAIVLDYAHNDIGLEGLARFSRAICDESARLHLVVGTAGDRRDEDFRALGRIAGEVADAVYLKDTPAYLRGRAAGEMSALMREGYGVSARRAELAGEFGDEFDAFCAALNCAGRGDVIAIMCQMDLDRIVREIEQRGGCERVAGD